MVFCNNCGNENIDNAIYCSECGEKLQNISQDQIETSEELLDKEILLELMHVSNDANTHKLLNRDIPNPSRDAKRSLYFTNENIYIGKGTALGNYEMVGSMADTAGWMTGGLSGYLIGKKAAKKYYSDLEQKNKQINFKELAAKDPSVRVIPHSDIINVIMDKPKTLRPSYITIKTSTEDYRFVSQEPKKYKKQFIKTIPAILGDRVIIGKWIKLYKVYVHRPVTSTVFQVMVFFN